MKKRIFTFSILFLAVINLFLSCADENDLDRIVAVSFTMPEIDEEKNTIKATDDPTSSQNVTINRVVGGAVVGIKIVNLMPSTADVKVDISTRAFRQNETGTTSSTHGADHIELPKGEANIWVMKNIIVEYDLPPGLGYDSSKWDRHYVPSGAVLMPEGGGVNTLFTMFDSETVTDLIRVMNLNSENLSLYHEPIVLNVWAEGEDNSGRKISTNKLRLPVHPVPPGLVVETDNGSKEQSDNDI